MNEEWESDKESSCTYSNYKQTRTYSNKGREQGNNQNYSRGERYSSNKKCNRNWNNRRNNENYSNRNVQGSVMYIDSCKVGRLIGKGGSKIKELENLSNAKIKVSKSSDDNSTVVTLCGSDSAQEKAKELIDRLLTDKPYAQKVSSSKHVASDSLVWETSQCETSISEAKWEPVEETSNMESYIETTVDIASIDWNEAKRLHEKSQQDKWSKYPPIIKNFYEEDPAVASMTKEEVIQFRKLNNNIEVQYVLEEKGTSTKNNHVPNPVQTFKQAFRNYPEILEEIKKQNFKKPSPIQCQAWPILLSGKDLIGIAQTGTGKTLAFLLPALIHIDGQRTSQSECNGPNVLIMAPTRELALQIEKEVNKYSYRNIKAVCLYGGGSRKEQINAVVKGIQIVIATPGRLNDLVGAKVLDVTSVTYLVLDEADRMLDMGFEPQIRKSLIDVRPDRQTVMTSATWPQGVRRLAESYMKNPLQVFVGSLDLVAVHSVVQEVYIVDESEKTDILYQFFREMAPNDKVIVFCGKKVLVDDLASDLALAQVDCQSIHGGRDQEDREQALEDLKTGSVRILIATDVASRGIDIEDISHVINYDFPRDIEEYVHRVGRTGRAGRSGKSITLMTRNDWSHAQELINILEEANQEVPQELYAMAERYEEKKKQMLERKPDGYRRGGGRGGGSSRYGNNRWGGW